MNSDPRFGLQLAFLLFVQSLQSQSGIHRHRTGAWGFSVQVLVKPLFANAVSVPCTFGFEVARSNFSTNKLRVSSDDVCHLLDGVDLDCEQVRGDLPHFTRGLARGYWLACRLLALRWTKRNVEADFHVSLSRTSGRRLKRRPFRIQPRPNWHETQILPRVSFETRSLRYEMMFLNDVRLGDDGGDAISGVDWCGVIEFDGEHLNLLSGM